MHSAKYKLSKNKYESIDNYVSRFTKYYSRKYKGLSQIDNYSLIFVCKSHGVKVIDIENGYDDVELCEDCKKNIGSVYEISLTGVSEHTSRFIIDKYSDLLHRHYIKKKYDSDIISVDRFIELTFSRCVYCDTKSGNSAIVNKSIINYNGIDRIDSNFGYVYNNSVSCCKVCNLMKGTLDYKQFKSHISKIYKHLK